MNNWKTNWQANILKLRQPQADWVPQWQLTLCGCSTSPPRPPLEQSPHWSLSSNVQSINISLQVSYLKRYTATMLHCTSVKFKGIHCCNAALRMIHLSDWLVRFCCVDRLDDERPTRSPPCSWPSIAFCFALMQPTIYKLTSRNNNTNTSVWNLYYIHKCKNYLKKHLIAYSHMQAYSRKICWGPFVDDYDKFQIKSVVCTIYLT